MSASKVCPPRGAFRSGFTSKVPGSNPKGFFPGERGFSARGTAVWCALSLQVALIAGCGEREAAFSRGECNGVLRPDELPAALSSAIAWSQGVDFSLHGSRIEFCGSGSNIIVYIEPGEDQVNVIGGEARITYSVDEGRIVLVEMGG